MDYKKEALDQWEWMYRYMRKMEATTHPTKIHIWELKQLWADRYPIRARKVSEYSNCFACLATVKNMNPVNCDTCPVTWGNTDTNLVPCQASGSVFADVEDNCSSDNNCSSSKIKKVIQVMAETWK